MRPERRRQVEEVLSSALECPPEQRRAFVEKACAGDTSLHREIESLLGWAADGGSILDRSRVEGMLNAVKEDQVDTRDGGNLGRFSLLEKIGRRHGPGVQSQRYRFGPFCGH